MLNQIEELNREFAVRFDLGLINWLSEGNLLLKYE